MGAGQSTVNEKKLDSENKVLNDEIKLLNKQVEVLSDNTKSDTEKQTLLNDINTDKDKLKEKKNSLNISTKDSCEGCCDNLIKENDELKLQLNGTISNSNDDSTLKGQIKTTDSNNTENNNNTEQEVETNVEAFTNDNIDNHTFLIILVSIMFIYIFFKK